MISRRCTLLSVGVHSDSHARDSAATTWTFRTTVEYERQFQTREVNCQWLPMVVVVAVSWYLNHHRHHRHHPPLVVARPPRGVTISTRGFVVPDAPVDLEVVLESHKRNQRGGTSDTTNSILSKRRPPLWEESHNPPFVAPTTIVGRLFSVVRHWQEAAAVVVGMWRGPFVFVFVFVFLLLLLSLLFSLWLLWLLEDVGCGRVSVYTTFPIDPKPFDTLLTSVVHYYLVVVVVVVTVLFHHRELSNIIGDHPWLG
jgi:hypothetical protein